MARLARRLVVISAGVSLRFRPHRRRRRASWPLLLLGLLQAGPASAGSWEVTSIAAPQAPTAASPDGTYYYMTQDPLSGGVNSCLQPCAVLYGQTEPSCDCFRLYYGSNPGLHLWRGTIPGGFLDASASLGPTGGFADVTAVNPVSSAALPAYRYPDQFDISWAQKICNPPSPFVTWGTCGCLAYDAYGARRGGTDSCDGWAVTTNARHAFTLPGGNLVDIPSSMGRPVVGAGPDGSLHLFSTARPQDAGTFLYVDGVQSKLITPLLVTPSLAVDSAGRAHVAWNAGTIQYAAQSSFGSDFTTTRTIASVNGAPAIAVQPGSAEGSVSVAWLVSGQIVRASFPVGAPAQATLTTLGRVNAGCQEYSYPQIATTASGETAVLYLEPVTCYAGYRVRAVRGTVNEAVSATVPWIAEWRIWSNTTPAASPVDVDVVRTTWRDSSNRVYQAKSTPAAISGKVSLGAVPLKSIMVSLEDSTPLSAGGPKPVKHLVTSSGTTTSVTTPKATDDQGKYAFTIDSAALPAPVFPLRVRVTFDILDGAGQQHKVVKMELAPAVPAVGGGAPWVSVAQQQANPVHFDFSTAIVAGPPSPGDPWRREDTMSNVQPSPRLYGMAATYIALFDALVTAPLQIPELLPDRQVLPVQVLKPRTALIEALPAIGCAQVSSCPPGAFCAPAQYLSNQQGGPAIWVSDTQIDRDDAIAIDTVVLHEAAHFLMEKMYGSLPAKPGETAHFGYCNGTTTNSWTEGFADFLPTLIRDRLAPVTPAGTGGLFRRTGLAAWNLNEWPGTHQYQDPMLVQLEERRVAQLLWKLSDSISFNSLFSDPLAKAPCKSLFVDQVSIPSRSLIAAFQSLAPTKMSRVYVAVLNSNSSSAAAIQDLFVTHGFFRDNGDGCWDSTETPGYAADTWTPPLDVRAAVHTSGILYGERDFQILDQLPGSDLEYEAVEPDGVTAAAVDELQMDVVYDPPDQSLNYSIRIPARRQGAVTVEMPWPHYSARAEIRARRSAGAVQSSIPLLLTSRQYWDALRAAQLSGSPAFLAHSFLYRAPAGQVSSAAMPITSTILGPAPGGVLIELTAHFTITGSQPGPGDATYSWSSAFASFDDATTRVTRGVFPAGGNTVTVYGCNDAGVCATGSAHLDVPQLSDTTAPVILCPGDIEAGGAGTSGALVSFQTATATDDRDPSPRVTCTSVSPGLFGYGVSTVACAASDASGNSSSCSFRVIVRDVTPPLVQCPADVRLEGTGPAGASAQLEQTTATDNVDPMPVVDCDHVSAGAFAYGDTSVVCTARDSSGNAGSCSFHVSVIDTQPAIHCPEDTSVDGTGPLGAIALLPPATATDARDGAVPVSCDHSSGDTFGYGATPVNCVATDSSLNQATCAFNVVVMDTPPVLSLGAPSSMQTECGDAYLEPGFLAQDAREGDLTSRVQVMGAVDAQHPGSYSLLYSVTDRSSNAATATRVVRVVDSLPPTLTLQVSPPSLWPPDHRMVTATVGLEASDRCDPHPVIALVSVTSSEPDNGLGDGDTASDIQGADVGMPDTQIMLRAERNGRGNGRSYAATYSVADASGHIAVSTTHVIVPKSQRQ